MLRTLLLIILTFMLVACSSSEPKRNEQFHAIDTHPNQDISKRAVIETRNKGKDDEYDIVFIEFNDQGVLHDRNLMQYSLEHLKRRTKDSSITVIFTHGWHHDAEYDDDNVKSFHNLLGKLAQEQAKLPKEKRQKVTGVYMGWRGDSVLGPLIEYSSYWDRKKSAQKVGFGATSVFLEIEKITKQNKENRLVTTGHSFGALATYTALAPILQERYINSRDGESGIVEGFGDLVVLMNPAFEASLHLPIYELAQDNCRPYNQEQPVRLLTISSERDKAVRYAQGAALGIATLSDRHVSKKAFTVCKGKPEDPPTLNERAAVRMSPGTFSATVTHCLAMKDNKFVVKHKNIVSDFNPYLTFTEIGVMSSGHNDIWGDKVVEFVSIAITNRLYSSPQVIHINDGNFHRSKCSEISQKTSN